MTDWQALHRAVVEELDSDEPRLVLADALQAAGDPRGEFIAVQCELARLGCRHLGIANDPEDEYRDRDWFAEGLVEGDRARITSLRARERTLLDEHRMRWTSEVRDRFALGFVDHATAYGVTDVGATFDRAPYLRSLEVWAATPRHLADPRLGQLSHLGVDLRDLAASQRLFSDVVHRMPRLRSLHLHVDRPVLDQVQAMPGVEKLERLAVDGRYATALDDVLAVANISDLRISRGVRETGRELSLRVVAAGVARQRIRTLVLSSCEMRHEIAAVLRACPHLEVLRAQEDGNDWLGSTLPAIAALRELRVLDLTLNNLRDQLQPLLAGDYPALRVLGLGYCRLDDAEIRELASSSIVASLRVLDLRINLTSGNAIAKALIQSRHQPPLERLVVSDAPEKNLARELRAKFPSIQVEVRT
jgi:uncharacterized protein (TIGR02996 family)